MHALPRAVYARRRAALLDRLPDGAAVLLPTGSEQLRAGDSHYPFRPHSDFWYLTGFKEPDAWALLRKTGEGPSFVLFVNPKDPEREVWTGIRAGVQGAVDGFGADEAHPLPELEQRLAPLLERADRLYFSFGRHPAEEPLVQRVLAGLRVGRKAHLGPTTLSDAAALLAEQRLLKEPEELELMRRGAVITGEAHRRAMRAAVPGAHEYEVQAVVEYTFRRRGAWGWAYPSIVGGGANACILHYVENDAPLHDGDLLLIDAGAEVDGYATDVTRTFPVGRRFSGPQRDLYSVVLQAQEASCAAAVAGATLERLHEISVDHLVDGMLQLGLLTGSRDEAIEQKTFRRYYMHRTSHWLGLDVHDVGRYLLPEGEGRPLEPGMVLTVEPGLYVAPDDEQAPEAFRGIGVRIEDDVLVTEGKPENLTAPHAPKTIEAIEALKAEGKLAV